MPDSLHVTEADIQRPISELPAGTRVRKLSARSVDLAFGRVGTVFVGADGPESNRRFGIKWDGDERVFEYPASTLVAPDLLPETKAPVVDPVVEIETKVALRPAEAKLIKVTDQAGLDAVGERLAVNKALQKQAGEIFDPVIQKAHEAHKAAIAAKKKVTDPLTQEESILKGACQLYIVEQRRIAEEQERIARVAREAEERRLLAIAEEKRKADEAELNARLQKEHEDRIEEELSWLPKDTPTEVVQAICDMPAPEPVTLPIDLPELPAYVPAVAAVVLPKGLSVARKYKAEVTSITQLCRAVAEGQVPATYVTANMTAINARARADGPSMAVPGVRIVEDFTTTQRGR